MRPRGQGACVTLAGRVRAVHPARVHLLPCTTAHLPFQWRTTTFALVHAARGKRWESITGSRTSSSKNPWTPRHGCCVPPYGHMCTCMHPRTSHTHTRARARTRGCARVRVERECVCERRHTHQHHAVLVDAQFSHILHHHCAHGCRGQQRTHV